MGGRIGYPVAMRPLPCLLRILLCLALLANGTGAAFANTRMASEAVAGQGAVPCHEMATMHDAPPVAPPDSHEDCCPPGACLCSCVANASAIAISCVVASTPRPAVLLAVPHDASRASPLLAHLIRPPIG